MTAVDMVSVAALVCSLAGNTLVNYRRRCGFIVWTASNVLWILVNAMGAVNWPQVAMFVAYMCLNMQGYLLWGRKDNSNRKER